MTKYPAKMSLFEEGLKICAPILFLEAFFLCFLSSVYSTGVDALVIGPEDCLFYCHVLFILCCQKDSIVVSDYVFSCVIEHPFSFLLLYHTERNFCVGNLQLRVRQSFH